MNEMARTVMGVRGQHRAGRLDGGDDDDWDAYCLDVTQNAYNASASGLEAVDTMCSRAEEGTAVKVYPGVVVTWN